MKTTLTLLITLFICLSGFSQNDKRVSKIQTAEFKVSTECHVCKDNIEAEVNYLKGVVYVNVKYEEKVMKVKYNTKKTDEMTIKKAVAAMGYDCGDVKATSKAKNNLGHVCEAHKGHHHH